MFRHCLLAFAITILSLGAAIAQTTVTPDANGSAATTEEKFDSPRLAALAKEVKAGNRAALDAFWQELKDKAPLVEPVAGAEKYIWVSYIWRGDDQTKRVDLAGGLPTGDEFVVPLSRFMKPLARLLNTGLWYRTERLPNDARFTYSFVVNLVKPEPGDKDATLKFIAQLRLDPFNPQPFPFRWSSIIELPAAPDRTIAGRASG